MKPLLSDKARSFAKNALRRSSIKWHPRRIAEQLSRTAQKYSPETKRVGWHFRCGNCEKEFREALREMDHIVPVVDPVQGFTTLDNYAARLLVGVDGWQALCSGCHDKKTGKENKKRTKGKRKKKCG